MEKINLSGCVIIEGGRMLLLWKIKDNHYELPGGRQEPGETLEETAIREAAEEIGCDVTLVKKIDSYEFTHVGKILVSHRYLAKINEGERPRIMEPEVFREILWMPRKDYKKLQLAPNVKELCERYFF